MQADATWVVVVKQLADKGITDPALLVFIVNNCDIELPTGRFNIVGGFPRSLATVAAALGSEVKSVEWAYLERTARRSDAAKLIGEARNALPAIRAALPGVRVGDRMDVMGADPARLVEFTRYVAKRSGTPLPPPRSSPEWKRIIASLRSGDPVEAEVLVVLMRFRRVVFASEQVAEPLEEDDAYLTVAEALGTDLEAIRSESSRRFASASLAKGPNYARSAVDLERVIAQFPNVTVVERVPETFPQTIIAKRTVDGSSPRAPWEVFTEAPTSLRWRMGPGEDLMGMWQLYWASLDTDEREAYLAEHAPPAEWRTWLQSSR